MTVTIKQSSSIGDSTDSTAMKDVGANPMLCCALGELCNLSRDIPLDIAPFGQIPRSSTHCSDEMVGILFRYCQRRRRRFYV